MTANLLTLNSSMTESDSKTNSPKYTTLHSTRPTLLETTNILPSLAKLLNYSNYI